MSSRKIEVSDRVPRVQLSSGRTIPNLGFGVFEVDPKTTTETVYNALVTGYRLIDSAAYYKNEKATGEAISKFLEDYPDVKRSDIYYTTKVKGANYTYNAAAEQIKEALQRVEQLEYIDLLLVHFPSGNPESRIATYQALVDAQKEGIVKDIGVSNYSQGNIQEIIDAKLPLPVLNQIELSPWNQRRDLVSFLRSHHIAIEAWGPLTRGTRLTEDARLQALAKEYNKTPAQILLKWSLDYGAIPLPKTTHTNRMQENLDVFDFEFSREDFASLGDPNDYYLSNGFDPISWPAEYDPFDK